MSTVFSCLVCRHSVLKLPPPPLLGFPHTLYRRRDHSIHRDDHVYVTHLPVARRSQLVSAASTCTPSTPPPPLLHPPILFYISCLHVLKRPHDLQGISIEQVRCLQTTPPPPPWGNNISGCLHMSREREREIYFKSHISENTWPP